MHLLDWSVLAIYMALTLAIGLWLSRRASRSLEEFFVGGRSIPWWLAGASMAAITFNVDTPLYVAGLVITRGLAADEQRLWTVVAISVVVLVYAAFSGLWGVVATDFLQLALALFGAIVVV